jgi:uncharacterized protein
MKLRQVLTEKREEILQIALRRGARNVRVFGSVARGEDDDLSDIDILVSFDPGTTLLGHMALTRELQELLECKVDVVSDRGLRPAIKDRVLQEATPL